MYTCFFCKFLMLVVIQKIIKEKNYKNSEIREKGEYSKNSENI